jgi:hypothetical protein
VIFIDETAVWLGGTRGRRHVWRKPEEAFYKHVIRRRWKGFSEFIFWGVFSYDKKGPCYIWEAETTQEKRDRKDNLDRRNSLREKADKQKWMKA